MTSTTEFAPVAGKRWRNWGRTETFEPRWVARPRTVEEVQQAVQFARERGLPVKAVGAGHSFTAIASAPGLQIDLSDLQGVLEVDAEVSRVRLAAGTNLHQLPTVLEPLGLAMENLGDIDRQTIAGATSTGTHGTGADFRGISAQICALTLVTADGSVLSISETENPEMLPAARLGLGALGIMVDITIQCVPAFVLHAVERPEPFAAVVDSFEQRAEAADHFEFYWFPHTETVLTKTNTRLPADAPRRPLGKVSRWVDDTLLANGVFAVTCGLGRLLPAVIPVINRLATRLTGDREFTDSSTSVFTTKRSVRFAEMEYAVPREAVPQVLREIRALIASRGWKISFPLEVRVAAPDDLWLSTAFGRKSGYIAVHRYWREDPTEYFAGVEAIMRGVGGRPHWGKVHTLNSEALAELYPHHAEFVALRDQLDPDRIFTNVYLDRVLGP